MTTAGTEKISRLEWIFLSILLVAATLSLVWGWRLFWFLTDDAFISFRYVSNSLAGHGYVWNAPPFRPVEGYTSFLWVVLLDWVWRVFGAAPPQSANLLSLMFSWVTLLLGVTMVLRMASAVRLARQRVLLAALFALGVLTNRTFLAWTSSGLETAMFNCFLLLWVFCGLGLPRRGNGRLIGLSVSATLIYLTRPDGLLFAAATVALLLLDTPRGSGEPARRPAGRLAAVLPLLGIPAHLVWRNWRYGEWLPNTYYAKHTAGRIWPQSGARYLGSFLVEYSFWTIALVALVLLVVLIRRRGVSGCLRRPVVSVVLAVFGLLLLLFGQTHQGLFCLVAAIMALAFLGVMGLSPAATLVSAAFLAHTWYYTVVIGGDHFEFRVYSHLVPLLLLALSWMLLQLRISPRLLVPLFFLALVLSWPVQWTHYALSRHLVQWSDFKFMKVSVVRGLERCGRLPPPLRGYLGLYDRMQFWLIDHAVCMRHQEHKCVCLHRMKILPTREQGRRISPDGFPVITEGSVGVTSWVLPTVNVIDVRGLNDYIIARYRNTRHRSTGTGRLMAHERTPPPGYLDCFRPNVTIVGGQAQVRRRDPELTGRDIVACEETYARLVGQNTSGGGNE
jgi:arabinofuranosyltransferase